MHTKMFESATALWRQVLLQRRILAAIAAAIAVWLGIGAVSQPGPRTQPVWVAATDVTAGTPIAAADLQQLQLPAAAVPADAVTSLTDVVGRTPVADLPANLPLTHAQLMSPHLLADSPNRVALGVRIRDGETVELLQVGDRIGLLATDTQGDAAATTLTRNARVVLIPPPPEGVTTAQQGRLVVLALTPAEANAVAAAAASHLLSLLWIP